MKINIASTHRFHLLDLARELEKQGHDVKFYSYVPTSRCQQFGLSSQSCSCLLPLVLPFFILNKLFKKKSSTWCYYRNLLMDWYMSHFMRKCDIYIGLGIIYKKSFIKAQKKGAITIIEWGSKHIDAQQKILKSINSQLNEERLNKIAREGYNAADYIAIPSDHVKKSFVEYNIPLNKLLICPYGVDIKMFSPTILEKDNYDIIMVGGWGLRKGCDLIIELCKQHNYRFLHVGSITDLPFPENIKNMTHIPAVNQKDLLKYYAKAKVFILPSREEGLAMVQVQAIACGLPVVCSKETGGRDLRESLHDKKWIIEMEELTVESLAKCIDQALTLSTTQSGIRNYAHEDINNLTWEAYGKRYNNNLKQIYNGKK